MDRETKGPTTVALDQTVFLTESTYVACQRSVLMGLAGFCNKQTFTTKKNDSW